MDTFLRHPGIRSILDLPDRARLELVSVGNAAHHLSSRISSLCRMMGEAGWTAWTAADRLADESGVFAQIDLDIFSSNLRRTCDILHDLNLKSGHREYIEHILAAMERANRDGMRGIRARSAWKSMGAAIPLICLMMKAGADGNDIDSALRYFYHFLLARQLSDDARDWHRDKEAGVLTLATQWIGDGTIMTREIRVRMSLEIGRHSILSCAYARKISCFKSTAFLEELPKKYAGMAERVISSYT